MWLVPRTSGSKVVNNTTPEKSKKWNMFRCECGGRSLHVQDDRTKVDIKVSDKDGSVSRRQWNQVAKAAGSGGRWLGMKGRG